MLPVESYTTVEKKDIQDALSSGDFLAYQGVNLLFKQGSNSLEEVTEFLGKTFGNIGKVAVVGKNSKHYLISDKFEPEVIEPFSSYENTSASFKNDIGRMAKFISYGHINYEV